MCRTKKWTAWLGLVVIAVLILSACQPKTVVVEKTVLETKVVEKVVTATPEPVAKPKVLRINLDTYPDIIDPQKSSFVDEIAHSS